MHKDKRRRTVAWITNSDGFLLQHIIYSVCAQDLAAQMQENGQGAKHWPWLALCNILSGLKCVSDGLLRARENLAGYQHKSHGTPFLFFSPRSESKL